MIVSERYKKSKSDKRGGKLNNPIVKIITRERSFALIDARINPSNNRRQFIIYNPNSPRHRIALSSFIPLFPHSFFDLRICM